MPRADTLIWILIIPALILYVASLVWAYKDAEQRGKPGWLVALLVALISWPLSLLLWLAFRPDHVRS